MARPKRKISAARRDLNNREHILYRFWNAQDVLLYVGITVDSATRLADHMRDKPWWGEVETTKFTKFPTRSAALEAEAEMIRTLKPLYNVQHNEMVEEPDEEDDPEADAWEMAESVLKLLFRRMDAGDRERLLQDSKNDWEGKPNTVEWQLLWASYHAVHEAMDRQERASDLVHDLMALLPDGGYGFHMKSLDARKKHPDAYGEMDVTLDILEGYISTLAGPYLAELGEKQADEWRQRAANVNGACSHLIDLTAARHARAWREEGHVVDNGCAGPGRHGALCVNLADTGVWFEICYLCPSDQSTCQGHRLWCTEHVQAAIEASLAVLETGFNNFPILRWEPIKEDDPWAVPF